MCESCGKNLDYVTLQRADCAPTFVDSKKAFAVLMMSLPDELADRDIGALLHRLSETTEKDLVLWGPEVVVLRNHIMAAFNEEILPLMNELADCFMIPSDNNTEITVREAKANKIIKSIKSKIPKVWKSVSKTVRAVLSLVYNNSRDLMLFEEDVSKEDRVTRSSGEKTWEEFILQALSNHLEAKFGQFPEKILGEYLSKLISEFQAKPDATITDRLHFMDRLDILKRLPANYFEQLSDVAAGRVWAFSGIQYAMEQGVTAYQIHGHMDALICPVCFQLNGKIFSVENLFEKMALFLDDPTNDDLQKQIFPFIKSSDVDNRQILPDEGLLPPFHPACVASACDIYTLSRGWVNVKQINYDDVILTLRTDSKDNCFVLDTSKMVGKTTTYEKSGVGFVDKFTGEITDVTEDHDVPIYTPDTDMPIRLVKVKAASLKNSWLSEDMFNHEATGSFILQHENKNPKLELSGIEITDVGSLRIVPRIYDDWHEFVCIELAEHNIMLVRGSATTVPIWMGNCRCNITMLKKTKDPEAPAMKSPATILNQLSMTPSGLTKTKIMELAERTVKDKLMVLDTDGKTLISVLASDNGTMYFNDEVLKSLAEKNVLRSSIKGNNFDQRTISFALLNKVNSLTVVTKLKAYKLRIDWSEISFGERSEYASVSELEAAVKAAYIKNLEIAKDRFEAQVISADFTATEAALKASDYAMRMAIKDFDYLYYSTIDLSD